MRRKWTLLKLVLATVIAAPLVFCDMTHAESGCHRSGGGTVTVDPPPQR